MCWESLCDDNFMRLPTIGLDLASAEIFRGECKLWSLLTSRPHHPPCDLATQSGSILRSFYCQNLHSQIMTHWRNSQKVWKVCETMNQNFISTCRTPLMFIRQMKCNSIFESLKLINSSQSVAHSSARSVSLSRHFNLDLRPAFSYGHTLLDTNLYFSSKPKWITLYILLFFVDHSNLCTCHVAFGGLSV